MYRWAYRSIVLASTILVLGFIFGGTGTPAAHAVTINNFSFEENALSPGIGGAA